MVYCIYILVTVFRFLIVSDTSSSSLLHWILQPVSEVGSEEESKKVFRERLGIESQLDLF